MPISVLTYQPLKGAAGNCSPPISSSMLATAGSAYQRNPSSVNHSSLRRARHAMSHTSWGAWLPASLHSKSPQGPRARAPSSSPRPCVDPAPRCRGAQTHVGCWMGTSRTSSGGRGKSSGASSGACSSRGRRSKRPCSAGAQPCWMQSCREEAVSRAGGRPCSQAVGQWVQPPAGAQGATRGALGALCHEAAPR